MRLSADQKLVLKFFKQLTTPSRTSVRFFGFEGAPAEARVAKNSLQAASLHDEQRDRPSTPSRKNR
jgi:hypothetical protein